MTGSLDLVKLRELLAALPPPPPRVCWRPNPFLPPGVCIKTEEHREGRPDLVTLWSRREDKDKILSALQEAYDRASP